ncbi:unnamed protein product [Zymoseptoria tritici ST99CH_1A5]|uniref:Uncharacterized protein n=3 Tax=Zymoseptoria tritici TaxID=1047171 RepID=A0A1X7RQV1_ZYMT9|nr:unnamed protein product [Zymoseptoria tritici ST99CH_3D7]SMR49195.1 unnamed protein product [Zymoseptoria tritici ST99CH_1E4]SMY23062.1 unnamed protein product [Zymoseptoria tritici ST99CH_1A5]
MTRDKQNEQPARTTRTSRPNRTTSTDARHEQPARTPSTNTQHEHPARTTLTNDHHGRHSRATPLFPSITANNHTTPSTLPFNLAQQPPTMLNTSTSSTPPLQVTDPSNDAILALTILFGVLMALIEGLGLALTLAFLNHRRAH